MLEDKNEFNKKSKRNRSTDFLREKDVKFTQNNIGNVSEDDEEEISDSSLEKLADQNKNMKKSKTYQIAHLTKKIWSNKIYSDDFDVDFEILQKNQMQRFKLGSVVNSAIQEDVESEIENPYFSDNSSSSQLTSKLRKFSLDFQKLLDKSDNDGSVLSMRSVGRSGGGGPNKQNKLSHYKSNLNEPIQEVEDEKEDQGGNKLLTETLQKRRKNQKHIEKNFPSMSSKIKSNQ